MNEKELTQEESIALIADMIHSAKQNIVNGASFHFLLWGWVLMLANFGHYFIEKYNIYEVPYIVWVITIPAAIASTLYGFRTKKQATVSTHLDKIYASLWICIMFMVIICLVFMARLGFNHNAVIMLFSGIGTFMSGIILKFRPLIIGGVILWIASTMGFMVDISEQQLISGIAIVIGYLAPGYLLRKTERDAI